MAKTMTKYFSGLAMFIAPLDPNASNPEINIAILLGTCVVLMSLWDIEKDNRGVL